MFAHGHTANDLLIAMLISIPKDLHNNLASSDNYRGIALCSALGKVIDNLILERYGSVLKSCNQQFAYKSAHSTSMCTSVVKEVIDYYVSNGSNVFVCALDASKAFDRVNHEKLFQLLLKRNIPGVIIRFLLDSYTRQQAYVKWNNATSDAIFMKNGVKQGGVLSPIMFCVYFDELFSRLKQTGVGCYIGHINYGESGYADDAIMLCPSTTGLQKLVEISEEFGVEYDVNFNPKKTVCMCFGDQRLFGELRQISLNGSKVPWTSSLKHLGNIIGKPHSDNEDLQSKTGGFIGSVNRLNAQFASVPLNIKAKLFQTYCASFYGCQTWALNSRGAERLNTE